MMNNAVGIIEAILIGLIAIYSVRMVSTYLVCQSFFSSHDCSDRILGDAPGISVIKSIWGLDAGSPDNYRSFCEQEYPGQYEIIFCAENRDDPSIPMIRQVISEYPEKDIRLVFSDPNDERYFGKIKNMNTGLHASKYEAIVFSDSDVSVSKQFLWKMAGCLKDPNAGLVYCPPFSVGAMDWKAAMLNMAVNENTMNIILLHMLGLGAEAVGTTMALRSKVIQEIGGLEQFGRQVTDDLPLARAVHKSGYNIHLLKEPAMVYHHHDTFGGWWKHMVRWLVMIRRYMPVAPYAGIIDMPLLLCLLFLCVSSNAHSGILLFCVLIFRLGYSALIHAKFVHDKKFMRFIWVVPVMDLLKLPLLIHSFLTNRIEWRGRKIYVTRNGNIRNT